MEKEAKRIPSGAIALLAVVLPAFLLPSLGICIFLMAIAAFGTLEFYRLLELAGTKSFAGLGVFFGALLVGATWLSMAFPTGPRWNVEPFLLTAMIIAVFLRLLPQKNNGHPLSSAGGTILGVLYVSFLFNYFTKLAFAWERVGWMDFVGSTGRMFFFYLLTVVKLADVGAYVVGSKWGTHKLIPRISPAKTWEGCFAALAFGLAGSLIFFLLSGRHLGMVVMKARDAVALGLLLPIMGIAGDLSESMLKRSANVKDSGAIAPGLGGVLDILDSLLFAVPALYYYAIHVLSSTS